jgi:hypothetical protein
MVLGMTPCTLKSDKEKSTYASLAQENAFPHVYLLSLVRLVNRAANVCTRQECNKYDLTAAPHFGLLNHNDWYKKRISIVRTRSAIFFCSSLRDRFARVCY